MTYPTTDGNCGRRRRITDFSQAGENGLQRTHISVFVIGLDFTIVTGPAKIDNIRFESRLAKTSFNFNSIFSGKYECVSMFHSANIFHHLTIFSCCP